MTVIGVEPCVAGSSDILPKAIVKKIKGTQLHNLIITVSPLECQLIPIFLNRDMGINQGHIGHLSRLCCLI